MTHIARVLTLSCGLLTLAGCGVGEYERRMQPTLNKLAWSDQFGELWRVPSDIPGTTFKLRMPMSFNDRPITAMSVPASGQGTVGVDGLQPLHPAIRLPGIRIYFQTVAQDNMGTGWPYCCHVAVVAPGEGEAAAPPVDPNAADAKPADAKPADAKPEEKKEDEARPQPKPLAEDLIDQIKATMPGSNPVWEDVVCETTTLNERMTWKRIRVAGEQEIGLQGMRLDRGPGAIDLYLLEKDGYQVVLLWRVLDKVKDKVDLDEMGRRVAGTLTGP